MYINKLSLENYRRFSHFEIEFDKRCNVLVGINASGKSTILDAASIALGAYFLGFKVDNVRANSIQKEDVRQQSHDLESKIDVQPQFPCTVFAQGIIDGENLTWKRSLEKSGGKTTYASAREMSLHSSDVQRRVQEGDSELILPLISYYGTGRLWAQMSESQNKAVKASNRLSGYIDCLSAKANEHLLNQWFYQTTMQGLEELQDNPSAKPLPELEAVKSVLARLIEATGAFVDVDIRYSARRAGLEIEYRTPVESEGLEGQEEVIGEESQSRRERIRNPREVLMVSQLSDGYRNTLSMVADIAYRMAVLNPQLRGAAIAETPGIVLIDEIDLHLHPGWQQHILPDLMELFPQVQFIVTTHAPAVISSVESQHIILLDDNAQKISPIGTYGKDVNSILKYLMAVEPRIKGVQARFSRFDELITQGKLEEADAVLNELEGVLGPDDHDVLSARITLDFEKLGDDVDFD